MRRSRRRSKEGSFEGPRYIPASRYIILGNEDIDTPSRDFCTSPAAFAEATERAVALGAMLIKLVASKGHREVGGTQRDMTGDELRAVVEVGRAHGARVRCHVATLEMSLLRARSDPHLFSPNRTISIAAGNYTN